MNELPWLAEARKYIGLKENTSKTAHNSTLLAMLEKMGSFSNESRAWWHDDETPWCGLFVGFCLGTTGRFVVKEWFRARSWESSEMTKLNEPAYGCIVTFTRDGGGHVGFVVGKDARGNILVLGGNQSNAVSIAPFVTSRVTGYFWPSMWQNKAAVKSTPNAERYLLPLLASNGKVSTNEA